MNEPSDRPAPSGRSLDHEVEDLLAGDIAGELSQDERARLESILDAADEQTLRHIDRHRDSLRETADLVALASDLARSDWDPFSRDAEASVPIHLADQIRRDATKYFDGANGVDDHFQTLMNEHPATMAHVPVTRSRLPGWVGWCVAAGLAAFMIGNSIRNTSDVEERVAVIDEAEFDFARFREQHPEAVEVAWTANGPDELMESGREAGADLGSLVWDTRSQSGLMRLRSLPVNDPSEQQYQLWIIDPARDDEPVDGGVFNVVNDQETVVAINAKLKVIEPVGFAITIEQPGGVVVSDQARMPLLALVSK